MMMIMIMMYCISATAVIILIIKMQNLFRCTGDKTTYNLTILAILLSHWTLFDAAWNWTVRAFLQLTPHLSNNFTAAWLTFTFPQLLLWQQPSIDYNVAMTFILNNNKNLLLIIILKIITIVVLCIWHVCDSDDLLDAKWKSARGTGMWSRWWNWWRRCGMLCCRSLRTMMRQV